MSLSGAGSPATRALMDLATRVDGIVLTFGSGANVATSLGFAPAAGVPRVEVGYDGANAFLIGRAGRGLSLGANNIAGLFTFNAAGTAATLAVSLSMNAKPLYLARTVVAYSAAMNITTTLANGFLITPTNGTAFTINNPSQDNSGQQILITIKNTFGVLGALTWGGNYKLGDVWVQPANGFSRTIGFLCIGAGLWVEIFRTAVDVAN